MVCPANSYSVRATALIFCRMFIHIMKVCMSIWFWFWSNILKMTGTWTCFHTSCIKRTWFVRLTPTVIQKMSQLFSYDMMYVINILTLWRTTLSDTMKCIDPCIKSQRVLMTHVGVKHQSINYNLFIDK